MLEHSCLVISPILEGIKGRYRAVHDGDSNEVLGHVFRMPNRPTHWLDRSRPRLETVCEAPDNSLLCIAQRTWWFGESCVLDAEQNVIAIVRRKRILRSDGRLLAYCAHSGIAHEMILRLPTGVELASVNCQGEQKRLAFHPRIASEPLVKMALLGAVLIQ